MNRYAALIKILETGSFSRAAEELGYTQSAVSQMLKSLEEELGATLLLRSRQKISLTANGEELLPYIRRVYNAHRELQEKQREMQGLQGGIIRIGTIASVSCTWLPGAMQAFKELYPLVQFSLQQQVTYTGIARLIKEGSVDFGFVNIDMVPDLQSLPLARDEMLAVLPRDHSLARGKTVPLELLSREPFILLEVGEYNELLQYFEQHNASPEIEYRVFDDYTIMAMIEKGMGVGVLPELILRRRGYDIAVRPMEPPFYRNIGIVYRERGALPVASRYFVDYLAEHVS